MYTLWGEKGSEKVYVLYTHLNVDNYVQSLSKKIEYYIEWAHIFLTIFNIAASRAIIRENSV